MKRTAKSRTYVPHGGGGNTCNNYKKMETNICFANMNNRRVYFLSAGKICYEQLRKIGPFIFALISLNNLNKQLSEI